MNNELNSATQSQAAMPDELDAMNKSFTPMTSSGTLVYLWQGGGFDVRNCPHPEALAQFIAGACNVYAAPPSPQPVADGRADMMLAALQEVAAAVQTFKRDWLRVPYFADRVNKASREAISLAHSPIVNLDAVGGPLDLRKYATSAAALQPVAREGEAGGVEKQTDLAKRLLEKAHQCSDQFNAITVTKADLIAICCEANRYYTGMANWKASAEAKDAALVRTPPAIEPVAGLTDAVVTDLWHTTEKAWLAAVRRDPKTAGNATQQFARAIERHLTGNAADQKGGA